MSRLKKAMVFAAGKGTRMRPLTDTHPKPLIEVAGKALLDHALDPLAKAGIAEAVVNTHYLADQIAAHTARRRAPRITISHEPDLLETGGGIARAAPLLGPGPILTLNADAVWQGPSPISTLQEAWRGEMGALLLLVPHGQAVGHTGPGDFEMDAAGRLARRTGAQAPFVYTGAQILVPAPVYAWPEKAFSLNLVWDALIREGRLFGALYSGSWADVGQPSSLPLAEAMLA